MSNPSWLHEIRTFRWSESSLPAGIAALAKAALDEGYSFLGRLQDEWSSGAVRFDGPGECLFCSEVGNKLVGVGGICRDPYLLDASIGRLRHVYVDRPFRLRGIAGSLVSTCLAHSGKHFRVIRLSTSALNPTAARLYEKIGFQPRTIDGERLTHYLSTN
jgi:ribosomal protein S18 acetylase RimI-like enzyme